MPLPFLKRLCLLAGATLACALAALSAPAPPEAGTPFIRNYGPKEYAGDFQNWAVVQDARGLIYVGNNLGVLEFDGARWRLIRTPGRNVVRSLGLDAQGRVHVGAVGEIGYLETGADGQTRYVDLNPLLAEGDRHFTDIWTTLATPEGMLFQSREQLLLLAGGRFRCIKASTSFHIAFAVAGRVFVRQRQVGLMELKRGRLEAVPGGERFAQESVFTMLPLDAGGILLGSRNLGLWRLGPAGLSRFPSEADRFLKAASLYHGVRLADGTLALATINGGVALLDQQGRLRGILDRAAGLQGDNVKCLFPDRQGFLWLGLDNGIARIEWPSALSSYDERLGLRGTVWSLHRHGGVLYAGTGQGVFALDPGAGIPGSASYRRPRFHALPGLPVQSIGLLSLDDTLLAASGKGIFAIRAGQVLPIAPSSSNAMALYRSRVDPDRVFAGLQGGIRSLRRNGRTWVDEGTIPGVPFDVYSLTEDADGRLWAGTGAQGVLRVSFPRGWHGGTQGGTPTVEHFTTAQGLPSDQMPNVYRLDGQPRFATHGGLYLFREDSRRFEPDPRFLKLFPGGPRWIKTLCADPQGNLWLDSTDERSGSHETGRAIPQPDGSYRWDPEPLRRFAETSVESLAVDPSGVVWFGGPEGLLRYDPALANEAGPQTPAPLIRRVTARGQDGIASAQVLPYASNGLRFEFALPAFEREGAAIFQVFLVGYDRDWSPWTAEAQKEYTNLSEGYYRFRVRVRDRSGAPGASVEFLFQILPPWYRTWWAYSIYLGLGSLALILGMRLRTRLLEARNEHLRQRVVLATEELRERERMLASQAGALEGMNQDLQALNERLRQLNDQKDRFVGIVVHDLRNPLNGILLAAELLEERPADAEVQSKAATIRAQATEMGLLIDRFLDIAALDAGALIPEPETFAMAELLREVQERHGHRARQKGLQLQIEPGPELALVHADRKFLRSVLDNLVSNALKFSPAGGRVSLALSEAQGLVRVTVTDQGPGLTEADRSALFGRFSKLSARPTAGEQSVGLGLSIAKEMIEAAGGRIWVASAPGQGASFVVELPGLPA